MAYSIDAARLLADLLAKFATLGRHQLAGQAANLDFWEAEAGHAFEVIDGYGRRHERMKAAQAAHVAAHETELFRLDDDEHTHATPPQPRRLPSGELADARRAVADGYYRFLVRLHRARMLDEDALRAACSRLNLGVETRDLRDQA